MKRKSYGYLLLFCIVALNLYSFMIPVMALEKKKTLTAIADSTIDLYHPTTNYGGTDDLEIGYFISWLQAYIKFDLSEAPSSFRKAELQLEFIYVTATTEIDIYETSSTWGEYTITWSNAPSHEVLLTSFLITQDIIYKIDLTNGLEYESGTWSICLASDDSNWLMLASRQCYSWYEPPKIVYYYEVSDLPIIIGAIVVIVVLVSIGVLIFIVRRKKKIPKELVRQHFPQHIPEQTPRQETPQAREAIIYCVNCGQPNREAYKFCKECGHKSPHL